MIELMILGFLAEGPLYGYELRRKMEQLHGYARTISDGTIYPAIRRLVAAGALDEKLEPGRGATMRKTLRLTATGRARLEQSLRDAAGHDITDGGRFFVILAFLSQLPDPEERRAVLQRRLDYINQPASFFYDDAVQPLFATNLSDPYRQGMLITAHALRTAELTWLRDQLHDNKENP